MSQPGIEAVLVDPAIKNSTTNRSDGTMPTRTAGRLHQSCPPGDDQTSAEEWGDLRFVPHERMSIEVDRLGWVPDLEPTTLVRN